MLENSWNSVCELFTISPQMHRIDSRNRGSERKIKSKPMKDPLKSKENAFFLILKARGSYDI